MHKITLIDSEILYKIVENIVKTKKSADLLLDDGHLFNKLDSRMLVKVFYVFSIRFKRFYR